MLAANIAAHWVQAGVVAAASLLAIRLLNIHAPACKLVALQLTLLATLLLPVMQPYVLEEQAQPAAAVATDAAVMQTKFFDVAVVPEPRTRRSVDPVQAFLLVLVAGVALRLTWLTCGVVRLARFSRRATEVAPPPAAAALEAEVGVSPRYILQTGNRGPWTFGVFRPTVALPSGFDALAPGFQRAAICHELLHVRRRDIAVALAEELAVATLWFHPWVWLFRARIRTAREQVVDAQVVQRVGNRDEYVRCLINISGHDLAPHFSQAGAGMLRPRELRARVDAIFQETHMSRRHLVAVGVALTMAVGATAYVAAAALPMRLPSPIVDRPSSTVERPSTTTDDRRSTIDEMRLVPQAGGTATPPRLNPAMTEPRRPLAEKSQSPQATPLRPAPQAPRNKINMVYPEYPPDALERNIQGTVVVDITVNAAGDVTTAAVASGPQELRSSAFKAALGLKFSPSTSTSAMKVSVDYTRTGNSWGVRIWDSTTDGARSGPVVVTLRSPDNQMPAAARVGGPIPPPRKIKDVPPDYPAIAQQARVQGAVILEARIDESGNVSHTHVLRSIPLLDQAAIDAVKQWQYEPMLMNGIATPVITTVTVNFSLRTLYQLQVVTADGNSGVVELFGTGLIVAPGGRVQLRASSTQDPNEITVSVFSEDGQTHLGDVTLSVGGPVVQTPTTPSIGLQFLGIR